ncbi:hypothetical protein ACWC0C_07025 [Streptomyces sp. NPDC001709]
MQPDTQPEETAEEIPEEAAAERGPSAFREIRELFRGAPQVIADGLTWIGARSLDVAIAVLGRIIRGGIELGRRTVAWVAEEPSFRWLPLALAAGAAYLWHPLAAIGAGTFVLAALANGGQPKDPTENDQEKPAGETSTTDVTEATEHAVAEAVAAGRSGIHLADLYRRIHPQVEDPTKHQLRDLHVELLAAKIPVAEQLKMTINGRQVNQRGVRADELTKALGHAPRLPSNLVNDLTPDPHTVNLSKINNPSPDPSPTPSPADR